MAKVAFSKLGLIKNAEVVAFEWNSQLIEVKQYLPVQEKIQLISNVLNSVQDENNFINVCKVRLYTDLEIVFKYTNITFTEKQKEDLPKLYDLISSSGLLDQIFKAMPENEKDLINMWVYDMCHNIYDYRNSIYGILDALKTDYSNLQFDANDIMSKIQDPEALGLLKDILTKIG